MLRLHLFIVPASVDAGRGFEGNLPVVEIGVILRLLDDEMLDANAARVKRLMARLKRATPAAFRPRHLATARFRATQSSHAFNARQRSANARSGSPLTAHGDDHQGDVTPGTRCFIRRTIIAEAIEAKFRPTPLADEYCHCVAPTIILQVRENALCHSAW
ncbi:hypothetical protein [Paraburkholderia guartelaensis]|uniref:hypothetical protein n=1 Tax=Paraburkholderia guartelaensis TaxID=2546446 RepID=UPI001407F9B1|nr:hypothetical protein [Paraburkholderia guartelaensis]